MLGMSRDDMLIKMVAKTLTRWVKRRSNVGHSARLVRAPAS